MSTYWALTVCPALYSALQILPFISPSWPPCKFYEWPLFCFQETKPWRDEATHPKSQLLSRGLQQARIQCYLLHSLWAKPLWRTDIFRTMVTGVVRRAWARDLRIWANRRGWQQSLPGLRAEYEKRLKVGLGRKDSELIHVKDRKARGISLPTLSPRVI